MGIDHLSDAYNVSHSRVSFCFIFVCAVVTVADKILDVAHTLRHAVGVVPSFALPALGPSPERLCCTSWRNSLQAIFF